MAVHSLLMQSVTSKRLFHYWDIVRGTRRAPRRFEIEPSHIADLLPETFIAEFSAPDQYYFRLAGTRIGHKFGRELRGANLLDFWQQDDLPGVSNLLSRIVEDAAVGVVQFCAGTETGECADFEMTLLPLVHSRKQINRLLGSITPVSQCQNLGTDPLVHFALKDLELIWPDVAHGSHEREILREEPSAITHRYSRIVRSERRCFRVYDGGLSDENS